MQSENSSRAVCILGMHRSGTSTVSRLFNLLGAYLGEGSELADSKDDNPKGFWERPDINSIHRRLLQDFAMNWDTTRPLPDNWLLAPGIEAYKRELSQLIDKKFKGRPLWSWKDPRTCLLLPLWEDLLRSRSVQLLCVFPVRSPWDVAASLKRRDNFPLSKGVGIWFNYNISALKNAEGLPLAFLSYDRLLESWEPEARRCTSILGLDWPANEAALRKEVGSFLSPKLRHSSVTEEKHNELPDSVKHLYQLLREAIDFQTFPPDEFFRRVDRIASLRPDGSFEVNEEAVRVKRPSYLERTFRRWRRSIRKRICRRKGAAAAALL